MGEIGGASALVECQMLAGQSLVWCMHPVHVWLAGRFEPGAAAILFGCHEF